MNEKVKLTEREKIEIFKSINFGDIDAYADPNLESYFIDNNYWQKIILSPIFYVVGKKGTGKSALYRMFYNYACDKGAIVSNHDFGDFPINRLANLSDDDFAKPNQYQSIWLWVILNIFTSLIVNSETSDQSNPHYQEIKKYYDHALGDASDLLRKSISTVRKKENSLELSSMGISPKIAEETAISAEYGRDTTAISELNRRLQSAITNYFKTSDTSTYIIQFDRLDDTYNQATELDTYFHIIISLMKIVYKLNCDFRVNGIDNAKVIVYLRTDIIDEIGKRDSESARWEDYTYKLNWAISNQNDWNNPRLLQMLDKRIHISTERNIGLIDLLDPLTIHLPKRSRYKKQSTKAVFKMIINQTMHRPRDLIKYCKCIQEEIVSSSCVEIRYSTINNAAKAFCYWLVNKEIANEINPIIPNVDELWGLLRSIGSKEFSYADFNTRFRVAGEWTRSFKADDLIEYLYNIGVLLNVNYILNPVTGYSSRELRSKIRNPGPVNRSMKLQIHPGIWKGIMQ